jgi:hypothetical protein
VTALDGQDIANGVANPNRVYAVDYDNSRVLCWTSIAAFAAHNGANIVLGQPTVYTGRCNYGGGITSFGNASGL